VVTESTAAQTMSCLEALVRYDAERYETRQDLLMPHPGSPEEPAPPDVSNSTFSLLGRVEPCDAVRLTTRLEESRDSTTLDVVASFGIRDEHNAGAIPRVLSGSRGRGGV
jgi:hypothetical protein